VAEEKKRNNGVSQLAGKKGIDSRFKRYSTAESQPARNMTDFRGEKAQRGTGRPGEKKKHKGEKRQTKSQLA